MEIKEIEAKVLPTKNIFIKAYNKVAVYCVKILLYTPITPNQVSILAIIIGLVATLFFATGNFWISLAGVSLLYLSRLCDSIDGILARCKKKTTKFQSEFLERFFHDPLDALIFIGLAIGVYYNTNNINYLLLGFFAGFFKLLTVYIMELRDYILLMYTKKIPIAEKTFIESKTKKIIFKALVFPLFYLKPIILTAILFNKLDWLIIFYAVFLPLRALLFFVWTYLNFGKLEKNKKKRR